MTKQEGGDRKSPSPAAVAAKSKRKKKDAAPGSSYILVLISVVAIPAIAFLMYQLHQSFIVLPGLVKTKSLLPKVLPEGAFSVSTDPDLYWGSYGANLYFGLRTRSPKTPTFGFMWFEQPRYEVAMPRIRHWCDQGDGLKYGWKEHDGRTFGIQELIDNKFSIYSSFVKRMGGKHGGDWTARIDAKPHAGISDKDLLVSFIVYFAVPEGHGSLSPIVSKPTSGAYEGANVLEGIKGETPELGRFKLKFTKGPKNMVARSFAVSTTPSDFTQIVHTCVNNTDVVPIKSEHMAHYLSLRQPSRENPGPKHPNFIALQITFLKSTSLEVQFESESFANRPDALSGKVFDEFIKHRSEQFNSKFEKTFGLRANQYADQYVDLGKHALSNMLGSISYFYGSSLVKSKHNKVPVPYGPFELFTSIPSRPFFPRGFLWDEGFHHLLIKNWDAKLSLQMLASWLDLMNHEGWIPREQILGEEARTRVPSEFVVQNNENANPPMFFFLLSKFLASKTLYEESKGFFEAAFPRLQLWYNWLNSSQAGKLPNTYRWRGRNETTDRELNPKTLTSGLDDYPRASHPTSDEYHVDLQCWMAISSNLMGDLSAKLGHSAEEQTKFKTTGQTLSSVKNRDQLFWSEKTKRYCDYGLHTRNVKMERQTVHAEPGTPAFYQVPPLIRVTNAEPKLRLVSDTFGYVSLFPFFMRLLPHDSPKLEIILKDLTNPDLLWSPYGLRSLAKTSPLYNTSNTEHDPPYWR